MKNQLSVISYQSAVSRVVMLSDSEASGQAVKRSRAAR